jgi:Ran GTPase-activating protein (RanGAP) involved in mRNA processing and transport
VKELSNVIAANTAIETLDVGSNRLENEGAIHVANALAQNTNLKW